MRTDKFERLYKDHAAGLLSFLIYRTGDHALAEDLLADTFERVLRSHRRFDPRRGTEKAWLYTIALNLLRDHARRDASEHRAVERLTVGAPNTTSGHFDAVENREMLGRALGILTAEEREAIALRFAADLSLREVADVLGEKQPAVEARIYRAMRKLKDVIG